MWHSIYRENWMELKPRWVCILSFRSTNEEFSSEFRNEKNKLTTGILKEARFRCQPAEKSRVLNDVRLMKHRTLAHEDAGCF